MTNFTQEWKWRTKFEKLNAHLRPFVLPTNLHICNLFVLPCYSDNFSGKKLIFLVYLVISQAEVFPSGSSIQADAGGCQPWLCWQQYSVCSPSWEKSCFHPLLPKCFWPFTGTLPTWPSTDLYNTVAITETKIGLRLKILITNLISSVSKHKEEI